MESSQSDSMIFPPAFSIATDVAKKVLLGQTTFLFLTSIAFRANSIAEVPLVHDIAYLDLTISENFFSNKFTYLDSPIGRPEDNISHALARNLILNKTENFRHAFRDEHYQLQLCDEERPFRPRCFCVGRRPFCVGRRPFCEGRRPFCGREEEA